MLQKQESQDSGKDYSQIILSKSNDTSSDDDVDTKSDSIYKDDYFK